MTTTTRQQWYAILAPAILAGALAVTAPAMPVIGVLAVLGLVTLFAFQPMLGWLLVVVTYPFIYLQVFIGETVNIPYVDAFAILTFAGVIVRMVVQRYRTGHFPFSIFPSTFPGLLAFVAFLAAGALSLLAADDLAVSGKYLLRPLTFFYLAYVVLPLLVVRTPQRLMATFRVLFLVGGIAAAMGVWSLMFPPEPGAFRRAVPVIVHGMTPLGTNHNLIAEVLVSVIPIGIILAVRSTGIVRRWYVVGTCAYALVTLLTFSRNGWLTLATEATVLLVALARAGGMSFRRIAFSAAPIVGAAVILIGIFSTTTIARSSNRNRMQLTEIAIAQFRAHPITGAGVGTFTEAVARDRWYVAEFGIPQEAHGLVQKLLAETGVLGLSAFLLLLGMIVRTIVRAYRRARDPEWRIVLLALCCTALGSMVFQLFNTSYFVSKLWLPLGVALAAAQLAERGIPLRASKV